MNSEASPYKYSPIEAKELIFKFKEVKHRRRKRALAFEVLEVDQPPKRLRTFEYPFKDYEPYLNHRELVSGFFSDSAKLLYEYNLAFFSRNNGEQRRRRRSSSCLQSSASSCWSWNKPTCGSMANSCSGTLSPSFTEERLEEPLGSSTPWNHGIQESEWAFCPKKSCQNQPTWSSFLMVELRFYGKRGNWKVIIGWYWTHW